MNARKENDEQSIRSVSTVNSSRKFSFKYNKTSSPQKEKEKDTNKTKDDLDISQKSNNKFAKRDNRFKSTKVESNSPSKIMEISSKKARSDALGNEIKRGCKSHKVTFKDKIAKTPLIEFVNIASVKNMAVEKEKINCKCILF